MIVTYNWLKEYVDFDLTADELSHRLTMAGLEVDLMERIGENLDSVIVARLDEVEPHPEADRLTMCQVNTGSDVIPVVCGAKNHKAGDLVALAQVGSVLPGDFKIKKSKIRGAESRGMLCSEKELGLASESVGIMILAPDLPLGLPVFDALKLKDVRYEIGLTPNRSDCLSQVGVAREVAAISGRSLVLPSVIMSENGPHEIGTLTSVEIVDPEGCPRYMARLIQGVTIGASPEWLVKRLEAVGMRSINNVVDVTNYVLMELGQPLHAFDFNLLRGKRIIVRRAEEGTTFTTLDSHNRQLQATDMVICDAEGPVALAGIMGGENSEVSAATTDILLESAYFDPRTIRRTSKRLGIHSESSHRFERGVDMAMVPLALDRAAALIQDLAGGTVAKGRIDIYPLPVALRTILLGTGSTNRLLGLDLSRDDIARLLTSIQLECETVGTDQLRVTIPLSRHDLERDVDLIEEVARLNGYDRIPVTMPVSQIVPPLENQAANFCRQLRNAVVGLGFSELINYSFLSPSAWEQIRLPIEDARRRNVKILNPLTEEQSVMRTSLVPGVLESISRNLSYRSQDLSLFELRPVYEVADAILPNEKRRLCLAMTGQREPEGWAQNNAAVDFFDLKGVVENIAQSLNLGRLICRSEQSDVFFHPGKSCALFGGQQGNIYLGTLGEIHPQVQDNYDLCQSVYLADLDVEALLSIQADEHKFIPISRFPDCYRDSAFLLDVSVTAQELLDVVGKTKLANLDQVVLFDTYSGKGIPKGKKSLAIRARYRSGEKTLTEEEINSTHARLVKAVEKNLSAQIR